MPKIDLKFVNQPTLQLLINDDDVGYRYFNLVKENYSIQPPIFRDHLKYTVEYMHSLAKEAQEKLGWNWDADVYTITNTALLHKNIEELVGVGGFDNVPAEYDNLLHELHYCLHLIQDNKEHKTRSGWLQIEWYNDAGFPLDDNYKFSRELKFGDIKLQNPWVGHGPLQIYLEQDFTKISQTCKFHNFVKPGINLVIGDFVEFTAVEDLLDEFKKFDREFVDLHGIEKIKHYIGYPVVGRVLNLDEFVTVISAPLLEFENLKFYE
jgi:hypothetical protein